MENEQHNPQEPNNQNDFQHTPMSEHHPMPEHNAMPQNDQPQNYGHEQSSNYGQILEQSHHSSAGIIVLQWLTYALWGWTVFAMSFLTGAVMASFIEDTASDTFVAYAVAAVLVLLPIAFVCDIFYSRREPLKKTGGASIVLVIHAVIFALFAVGSIITVVFSIISMALNKGENKTWQTALFTALIVGLLYAAVLLRVLNPPRPAFIKRFFPIFMFAVVGVLTALAFLGPVKKANVTKTDRLVEANIGQLADKVNSYTNTNSQLPTSLKDVKASGDVKKLIDENLVIYKPNTKPATKGSEVNVGTDASYTTQKAYYYQLCVNYKKASNPDLPANKVGDYQSYISAYSHEAGEVCYKVATSYDYSTVQ